ncbi:hypothetical protein B0H11DRAFT_975399 [Mycena galericulata]|nr:hypothetical protein B0H11DRAFT_975399 [Mycena galericulata]
MIANKPDALPWSRFYIPAIYAILDPARIPSLDELDSEVVHTIMSVAQARVTIMTLHFIPPAQFPPGSFPLLWPRVWKWMEVLVLYRHCLPPPIPSESEMTMLLIPTIISFFTEPETDYAPVISATPGVRLFFAQSWGGWIAHADMRGLGCASFFISRETFDSPTNLEEYIHGVGGTATDLCSLVMRQINFFASHPYTQERPLYIKAVTSFVIALRDKAGLLDILLECGLMRAIITVVIALSGSDIQYDTGDLINHCFSILHNAMQHTQWLKSMSEMLEAGLLPIMVSMAEKDNLSEYAAALLRIYFPKGLLYHSVLSRVEASLPTVMELPSPPGVVSSPDILDDWRLSWDMLRDRIATKRIYDSAPFSGRICDNMECGLIATKETFRRCSGCQRRVYCSPECQTKDWRDDHRSRCKLLRTALLDPAGSRDRAFMRGILHRDYEKQSVRIMTTQIHFMVTHPNTRFFTVFNYDNFPPTIEVHPFQPLERCPGVQF